MTGLFPGQLLSKDAAAARLRDGGDHNRRETPLFAASIERHALGHK